MSILNLTEDEKLLYEKYNQSPDIIVKEETPVEKPVKVAEPVKAEESVQTNRACKIYSRRNKSI